MQWTAKLGRQRTCHIIQCGATPPNPRACRHVSCGSSGGLFRPCRKRPAALACPKASRIERRRALRPIRAADPHVPLRAAGFGCLGASEGLELYRGRNLRLEGACLCRVDTQQMVVVIRSSQEATPVLKFSTSLESLLSPKMMAIPISIMVALAPARRAPPYAA